MIEYDPKQLEKKWQEEWQKSGIYSAREDSDKQKHYLLVEFPYPSGNLHVGHWYAFSVPDIAARFHRMQGRNVMFPIGFDAFGLPAENAAIQRGLNPREWTLGNIDYMKNQLRSMGASFDWSREVITCSPEYYKWTQWLFLQFFNNGLAYQGESEVNWCPKDKTVLANEQVVDGKCERCGTEVVMKKMLQWNLKITDYADRLVADLDATDYERPLLIDKVNPHKPGAPEVRRRVAHAIVYDPAKDKFLIIRNKKFGWDTVVIGGIDGNESVEAAARREVEEETGYTDLEFKRLLGAPTEAHYHTPHKGENRIAIAQAAYFELKSDTKVAVKAENLTAGEASHNEVLWVGPEDFVPGKLVNSELPIWLERLSVEAFYDKKNPTVPHFKEVMGVSAYREGAPIVEREAVAVIIKHWKEDAYLGLKWKKVAWRTILTGGVEAGQTPEEAAIEEIRQETGYQNVRFVRKLGNVDASFFHVPKGVNRFGHFHALYFELIDGEQKELSAEEQENHDLVWVPKEEMGTFLSVVAQTYIWNTLFLGKKSHYIELAKPLLDWPRPIKEAQKNWIGKSEGALIKFDDIEVFTTRPDTIRGATFIAVSGKEDRFTGKHVTNPATGEKIPVWEAEYILADYGTGAIMGVPADDERDRAFALKHNLPIKEGYEKAGFEEFGKIATKYRLRDWVVSRQRYWGVPIPIIHCPTCGAVGEKQENLPVILPEIADYLPRDDGKSPLAKARAWAEVSCPKCGGKAERETDTLDTFVDSSWYFLRYADPKNEKEFASKKELQKWLPVDFYSGGAEHTTMHLLYSRFWHKALFDLGLVFQSEPYLRRMNRGLILGPDGHKMSKSKGNVIDPDREVERFGADTVRTYLAFIGPFNEVGTYPWNPDSVVGVRRFLERVWRMKSRVVPAGPADSVIINQAAKKVSEEIESMKMNTAVSALMILVNDLDKQEQVTQAEYEILLTLLAPFAPHLTEELWHELGHTDSIHLQAWPQYDPQKLVADTVTIVVQVNGKVRGDFTAASTITEAEAVEKAKHLPLIAKWIDGKEIKKAIYVPGKLVNFVLA